MKLLNMKVENRVQANFVVCDRELVKVWTSEWESTPTLVTNQGSTSEWESTPTLVTNQGSTFRQAHERGGKLRGMRQGLQSGSQLPLLLLIRDPLSAKQVGVNSHSCY
jgi:hypothetical protein